MQTKRDLLDICTCELQDMHPDNIDAIFGNGSFFHGNLDEEATDKERTIDFIILIDDLDGFYKNHVFEMPELSTDESRQRLKEVNEKSILYIHQTQSRYRITVVPTEKFTEWTSPGSSIGYFLRGRMHKPLEEVLMMPGKAELIGEQLRNIRKEAIAHTFRMIHKPTFEYYFFTKLISLSYRAEGWRGGEAILFGKHRKIFKSQKDKFYEIYKSLIEEYIKEHDIRYDGYCYYPNTTRKETAQFKRELGKMKSFYAKILLNLQSVYPDPQDFYTRKILRVIKMQNSNLMYKLISRTYPAALAYTEHVANKNPDVRI